jgi:hypothetical protein
MTNGKVPQAVHSLCKTRIGANLIRSGGKQKVDSEVDGVQRVIITLKRMSQALRHAIRIQMASTCLAGLMVMAVECGCSHPTTSITPLPRGAQSQQPDQGAKAEAARDISRGALVIKTFGFPAPWSETYRNMLQSRYNIELRAVAGCCVTPPLIESVKAYNKVAVAEIERRHGKGVLAQVATEAERAWKAQAEAGQRFN